MGKVREWHRKAGIAVHLLRWGHTDELQIVDDIATTIARHDPTVSVDGNAAERSPIGGVGVRKPTGPDGVDYEALRDPIDLPSDHPFFRLCCYLEDVLVRHYSKQPVDLAKIMYDLGLLCADEPAKADLAEARALLGECAAEEVGAQFRALCCDVDDESLAALIRRHYAPILAELEAWKAAEKVGRDRLKEALEMHDTCMTDHFTLVTALRTERDRLREVMRSIELIAHANAALAQEGE